MVTRLYKPVGTTMSSQSEVHRMYTLSAYFNTPSMMAETRDSSTDPVLRGGKNALGQGFIS